MKKYVCPTCNSRCDRPYCNECERTIPANCTINVEEKAVEKVQYCKQCGAEVKGNKTNCPYCGELLLKGTNNTAYHYIDDHKHSYKSYTASYILSILIPLVGLIMGAIYLTRDDEKGVGGTCIMLSILSSIICSAIYWFAILK